MNLEPKNTPQLFSPSEGERENHPQTLEHAEVKVSKREIAVFGEFSSRPSLQGEGEPSPDLLEIRALSPSANVSLPPLPLN